MEKAMFSVRTKAAPAAAKARGVKLGGPKLKAISDGHAASVIPIIRDVQKAGAGTPMQIADALNVRGVATPRGGRWYATSVKNVLGRPSPALCTLYPEHVELAEQVAKDDRATAGMGETQARRKITRAGGPCIVERRPLIHGQIAPTFIGQNAKRFLHWRLKFIRPC